MQITFTHDELKQMPHQLSHELITWMNQKNQGQNKPQSSRISNVKTSQAPLLQLLDEKTEQKHTRQRKSQPHIPLTKLFDAGLISVKMPVRVRLTSKMAKKTGRDFINGMEISSTGKINYNSKEFNKPSPLADEINNTSLNGWDYVQVKKNNQWIFLKELRETYKQVCV